LKLEARYRLVEIDTASLKEKKNWLKFFASVNKGEFKIKSHVSCL
jgi:hypothetical protein